MRILAAARDLFSRHGIRAVGIEAIAEAGATNKATLYRHFRSKDGLVAAYVSELAEEGNQAWESLLRAHPTDANAQVDAWLRHVEKLLAERGGRGCAIANAAVELRDTDHPARTLIDAYKSRARQKLANLFARAGYRRPEVLADEVFLLLEGALVSGQFGMRPAGPDSRVPAMLRSLLVRSKAGARQDVDHVRRREGGRD